MSERQRPRVGEILVQAGVIDAHQLRSALGEQARWGRPLGATLIKLGFVGESALVRALASQLDLPMATLEGKRIPPDVLDLVPRDVAMRAMVIPLFVKREGGRNLLYLGVEDPSNLEVFDDLAFRTGMQIKPVMVCSSELCEAVDRCYRRTEPAETQLPAASVVTPGTEELARFWSQPTEEPPPPVSDSSAPTPQSPASPPGVVHAVVAPSPPVANVEGEPSTATEVPDATSRPAPVEKIADASARPAPADPHAPLVLRAIVELLIEKGVLTRDQIHEKLRDLQLGDGNED